MHFEVLVEDQSGKHALDILIPKIIGSEHSFKVHAYRGIGHIPKISRAVPMPVSAFCLTDFPSCSGDMEEHLQATGRTIQQQ